MAENMIKFLRGNVADLPKTATAGALYFTKDEGVYLGLEDGSYHRYGDFITVSDVASLPATGAHQNCMYYCVSENILAKWSGSEWVQINKQKTLAELGGVDKSVYEAKIKNLEQTDANNATAISNLETYVGTIPETATATDIVSYVQEKTSGIATDTALTELTGRVSTAESEIDALQAAIADGGSVANAIADAKKAGTDAAAAAATAQATANSKTTMAEVEAKNYATKTEAQGYADAKDSAISAAKAAADAAQADVDALETKVGTVPEKKTVVQMIADAQSAATYDDTAVKASIKVNTDAIGVLNGADTVDGSVANAVKTAQTTLQSNIDTVSGKVTTLVGSVEGDDAKSARTIASEEVAKIVAGADTAYDTLKEISDWISSHKTDATAMNSAIIALENIVDGIGGDGEKATVVAYVTDAIAALNIGDYAKAADLTALAGRVSTVEGKIDTINGGDTTVGSIKKALADAKAYTDEKDSTMNTRVKAVEDAKHTHANKAELDLINTGDVAKWNAAQANAESTAATALNNAKKELNTAIGKKADKTALDTTNSNVTANTNAIATINGTGAGSFAKADADLKTELKSYADTAESDAVNTSKAYTDSCLTWGSF